MKKQLLTIALFCATCMGLNAQNEDFRSVVSVNAGLNAFGVLGALITNTATDDGATIDFNATPSFSLGYDYGINKWFSLGGHVAFNSMKFDASNLLIDATRGDVKVDATRIPVQLRALFHYGNSGKLDMYSGIGLGMSIWNAKVEATDSFKKLYENAEDNPFRGVQSGAVFTGQIVPFGLRYYVSNNLGLGFETGMGAPYFFSAQVNYRLGGSGK